jgi:glycosyltransferase involved in cell wall biosynthesis
VSRGLLILPAFDEAERLPGVLARIAEAKLSLDVVVIDDGSRDATARVAREAGAVVLRHPFNLGYGAALQTGYKYALAVDAPFLVQMDADGQHDPREVPTLLAPLERGECDLVVGSRFLSDTGYHMGALRRLGRGLFRAIARGFGIRLTDPTSGFQALGRRVLALHASDAFPSDYPDVDVLVLAHRHGLLVRECPVRMAASPRPSTLHGGLRSAWYLYKMLLSLFAVASRRREAGAPPRG